MDYFFPVRGLLRTTIAGFLLLHLTSSQSNAAPFEIRWSREGLEFRNVHWSVAHVILPAPEFPDVDVGTLESIMWGPDGRGGFYYYHKDHNPSEPQWNMLLVWPPPTEVVTKGFIRNSDNGSFTIDEMFFGTSILGESSPSSGSPENLSILIRIPEGRVALIGYTVSAENRHPGLPDEFPWAGFYDLNIDGEISNADAAAFGQWYDANDRRADWDQNGILEDADRIAFALDFQAHAVPTDSASDEQGGSSGDQTSSGSSGGGCALSLSNEISHHGPFAMLLLAALAFLFFVRRKRQRT